MEQTNTELEDLGDFNIDPHLIVLQNDEPFFCEYSRYIRKIMTDDPRIPTAAITYDKVNDDIVMLLNNKFFRGLTNKNVRNVIVHEFYHSIFMHLTTRIKTPHKMWNISTDCAINSIIVDTNAHVSGANNSEKCLPPGCVIPGQWIVKPDGRQLSAEEKTAAPLAEFIANLPTMKSSEFYFNELSKFAEENGLNIEDDSEFVISMGGDQGEEGVSPGGGSQGSLDSHEGWGDIPEDKREYIESKIKQLVEKAVKYADSRANGWGTIPSEIRDEIRRSVSNLVNWKSVLKQFIGTLARGNRTTSIKQINRRYPYIHPGTKRGYDVKLLIAMDQSGSVCNEMLEEFFGVLASLTKKVSIDVMYFDCGADVKEIIPWRKGQNSYQASSLWWH
jgi:predicted metal-dependent peptidase